MSDHNTENYAAMLHEAQQASLARRGHTAPAHIRDRLPRKAKNAGINVPNPSYAEPVPVEYDLEELIRRYEIPTLGQLRTDHMSPEAAAEMQEVKAMLRGWRERVGDGENLSVLLSSPTSGTGKTHMAGWAAYSFCEVLAPAYEPSMWDGTDVFDEEKGEAVIVPTTLTLTDQELLDMQNDANWRTKMRVIRTDDPTKPIRHWNMPKLIVVDDIGQAGLINKVKQDPAIQEGERKSRYFRFVDWAYTAGIPLFITTNLAIDYLKHEYFNTYTWTRLDEMTRDGHMYGMTEVPPYRQEISGRK